MNVLKNAVLDKCMSRLTKAWDDGQISYLTYAYACAGVHSALHRRKSDPEFIIEKVERIIRGERTWIT